MHILILPSYYPEPGKASHVGYLFYEQAMQIAHSGCQVGLAYTEQRLRKDLTWKTFFRESHFQISHEDNGTFVTMRMHAWNPKLSTRPGGILWSLMTLILVHSYIRRYGKPDIIHAHFGIWAGYAASLIYKRYGIPYVITEHASSINDGQVSPWQADILKTAYKYARQAICVGTALKKNLAPYLSDPDKAIVIPNFVDISTFGKSNYSTEKEKKFTFVSIGNLIKLKGFSELIEAFHQSFHSVSHVSLFIVGGGEEADNLQSKIHTLNLEKQVFLKGRLSREKVARLLETCDAYVLASYTETFGIVLIEAMATGIPVIATFCGGPKDIVTQETGFLVEPHNVKALAEKMRLLYDTYEQFDKDRIRQSVVERFDIKLAGKKLKEIYLKAIKE